MRHFRFEIGRARTEGLGQAVVYFAGSSALGVSLLLLIAGVPPIGCVLMALPVAVVSAVATVLIWPWRGDQPVLAAIVVGVYAHPLLALCFATLATDSLWWMIVSLAQGCVEMAFSGGIFLVGLNGLVAARLKIEVAVAARCDH